MPAEFRRASDPDGEPGDRSAALAARYRPRSAALQVQMWQRLAAARSLRRLPRRAPNVDEVRDYAFDFVRRSILWLDVLRRRGNEYFAVFFPDPEPSQTLAAVGAAESHFVREVARRHPDSPKPAIVGNCQGGWAVMGLAAADPDITGPLVLNGAPLSYWAGVHGRSPMGYLGGLAGGSWPAYLLS